jgi:hypothetical protein
LVRVAPPHELLNEFAALGYEVCFCRQSDLALHGGRSHTIRDDLPGHGIALRPVRGLQMPPMTDLLAIPQENLTVLT